MTSVAEIRTARELLAWGRRLVDPPLREAVDTLPETTRQIAGYHFGWWEAGGPASAAGAGAGPGASSAASSSSGSGSGGKALRPTLVLLAARAAGGDPVAALPAAVAVELLHNYSLIHDDVIDGDLTRRHRPCVWSVFGTGPAILVGSALQALALEVLASSGHPAATRAVRMLGSTANRLLEGQHADLAFERRTDVELAECIRMVQDKSGALLGCASALGATLAGATDERVRLLRDFGAQLGLAFQLTDDLLGIWGDPEVTGKPVHSDLRRRKKSLPVVAALASGTEAGAELAALYHRDQPRLSEQEVVRAAELVDRAGGRAWSRARADDALKDAVRALRSAVDPAGPTAVELAELARRAVHRDH